MTNKFAPTYRSQESSNHFFGSYMTNGRQRVKDQNDRDIEIKDFFQISVYISN